eukprot:m.179818 g.179818  ORF g.179818 m.179818 type:complete len:384 (-) comp14867_c0_seq1:28-1179(-)
MMTQQRAVHTLLWCGLLSIEASSTALRHSRSQSVDVVDSVVQPQNNAIQYVTLSMDDALHESNGNLIEKVPGVNWTFFISVMNQQAGWYYDASLVHTDCVTSDGQDTNNEGCLSKADVIRAKYAAGHEMALHTYTHLALASGEDIPDNQDVIMMEIGKNFDYLVQIGVAPEDITGFRAPFLDTASWGPGHVQDTKNKALRMMQAAFNKYGILYDSTFTAQPDKCEPRRGVRHCSASDGGWAYHACGYDERASYAWDEERGGYPSYTNETNPSSTWHIFMNAYTMATNQLSSMDQANLLCKLMLEQGSECTVDDVRNMYMNNFLAHYRGARHPFGVFLHGGSLIADVEVAGLNAFLDDIRGMSDVQITTMGNVARIYRERNNYV